MGYTRTVIKGVSWVGSLRILTRALTLIRTAILARILNPFEFGLFGIASLITALLETMTETGVNIVLVQEKENIDSYISSAWIISIARGISIATLMLIFASIIASFFKAPASFSLIIFMSAVPFIRGFINPAIVKFQKELKFKWDFLYNFLSFLVLSIVSIVASYILKSAAGLILGLIASALVEIAVSFTIVSPRPHLVFDKNYLKTIFHRGKWVTMAGISEYLFQNVDNIVVGRLLGVSPLGLYQMGYKISIVPISEGTDVLAKVTFPIYVKISDDLPRLKRAFYRSMAILTLITVPFGLLLFIFPKEIVSIVLGDKWIGIVPIIRILAIFGVVRALSNLTASAFMALSQQKMVSFLAFLSFLILAITVIPLVLMLGIVGAALSALTVSVIVFPVSLYYLNKLLKVKK